MEIIKFRDFVINESDSDKESIDKMSKGVKKNIEMVDNPKSEPVPDTKGNKEGPLPDDPNLSPRERITRLAKHVYDAYYKSNYMKYEIKAKVAAMKADKKISPDEVAEFEEMQVDIMANELLRGDNIEIQMVSIAGDSSKLAQMATELANQAKSRATNDATTKMADKVNKKFAEPKPEPEDSKEEDSDDEEESK